MISIQDLLYKLDLRLNKVDTGEHQSIPTVDKLYALNQAQIQLVKKKLNSNNVLGLGMDSFKKRYEDLQGLAVQFEKLTPTKTKEIYSSYEVDLSKLSKDYMLPLEIYSMCSRGSCTERPVIITRIVRHGDIGTMMNNNHYKPSFEYQESIAVISDDKLIIYTDGTFTVDEIHISYLKYPTPVDYDGVIHIDGRVGTTVNSELPKQVEDELLNLATLELGIDTENLNIINTSELRRGNNE